MDSTNPFDPFAWRAFTEQTNLAKTQAGDWIYTTPEPEDSVLYGQLVQLERPQYAKGIARKVQAAGKHPEGGRQLVFEDGTTIVPRNGTAAAYRFLTTSAGEPLPVPTYPTCPTCGSDGPSCVTNKGDSTGPHATRKKLPAPAAKPKPFPARPATSIDGSYAAAGTGMTVHKGADGNVVILGWDRGELETVTPEGWRVHVSEDGEVTVLGSEKLRSQLPPTDADDCTRGPIIAPKGTTAEQRAEWRAHEEAHDEVVEYDESDPVKKYRCDPCKGYGVVRGGGPNAGRHYRKPGGALQAKANGNAVDCPACQGRGYVLAVALDDEAVAA